MIRKATSNDAQAVAELDVRMWGSLRFHQAMSFVETNRIIRFAKRL